MNAKHQLAIWKLLLAFHLISVFLFPSIETSERFHLSAMLPRLFVFFYWKAFDFAGKSMLLAKIMVFVYTIASFLFLIIPAFKKTRNPPTVVCWVLILGVIYCCIDVIGCLIIVPQGYHHYFSVIMDCFIVTLSVWTLNTVKET